MKRLFSVFLVLVLAASARAHFVWLVPSLPDAERNTVQMIFSDNLKPDPKPELLDKIAQTLCHYRSADGGSQVLPQRDTTTHTYHVAVPEKGAYLVTGQCDYGVVQRGKSDPFLLVYYPKTVVGLSTREQSPKILTQPSERLPLEIVPVLDKKPRAVRVLWQGKPLEGAEVVVLVPGQDKGLEGKTDQSGLFSLEKAAAGGLYGIRARHVENKEGEHDGKKYKEIRRYATLTLALAGDKPQAELKPDPEATKLLADARAARANWDNFPGFAAEVEVNIEGQLYKTHVTVSPKGEVDLKLPDKEAERWARRQLSSLVSHRLDNGPEMKSQCAFPDNQTDYPLGRAIRVLDDEFHSSYRIRDRQVIVVNRTTKDSRFTITVLENLLNQDKHYLPVSFVVNYWDLQGGSLKRSDAHHHTWTRVGQYDLPVLLTVVTALPAKQEARSIKLSKHQLLVDRGR